MSTIDLDKLTEEQQAQLFQQMEQKKKEKAKKKANEKKEYKKLVNENVLESFEQLSKTSAFLTQIKKGVIENFISLIEIKKDIYKAKQEQMSHTFISDDGQYRVMLGFHSLDTYDDTVNVGIEKVNNVLDSLVKDEDSKALVATIKDLMSKDKKGNLKPSRILQLGRLAQETDNQELKEAVEIIINSHKSEKSKQYVRAQYKNTENKWEDLALSMTEA